MHHPSLLTVSRQNRYIFCYPTSCNGRRSTSELQSCSEVMHTYQDPRSCVIELTGSLKAYSGGLSCSVIIVAENLVGPLWFAIARLELQGVQIMRYVKLVDIHV